MLGGTVALDARELRWTGAAVLAAGAVLPALPGEPGAPCVLRTLTGSGSRTGLTTSVVAALHFDPAAALAANPGGVAVVVAAIALLVVRPVRLPLPVLAPPLVLAGLWLFELHRFSIL